jgi:hypothetical protein
MKVFWIAAMKAKKVSGIFFRTSSISFGLKKMPDTFFGLTD